MGCCFCCASVLEGNSETAQVKECAVLDDEVSDDTVASGLGIVMLRAFITGIYDEF